MTVRVEFKYDANFVADNDVVLTTYELLRSKPTTFRKVCTACRGCTKGECGRRGAALRAICVQGAVVGY